MKTLGHTVSPDVSFLKKLKKQVVIGSTLDPVNGAQNPYGLTIAPSTNGAFTAGDLVVCNFNAKSNVQGTGKSIIALHPTPGSTPDARFLRCNAQRLRRIGAESRRHHLGGLDGC